MYQLFGRRKLDLARVDWQAQVRSGIYVLSGSRKIDPHVSALWQVQVKLGMYQLSGRHKLDPDRHKLDPACICYLAGVSQIWHVCAVWQT